MRSASFSRSVLVIVALTGATLPVACKKPGAGAADAAADASAAPSASASDTDDVQDAAVEAAAPLPTAQGPAQVSPFAEGQVWTGTYTCAQGDTQLSLIIHTGAPKVNAVFSFKKGVTAGQFKMSGAYNYGTRSLHLTAGEWINHPGNYVTVDLDGKVSADGHSYSGSVKGSSCTSFSVRR